MFVWPGLRSDFPWQIIIPLLAGLYIHSESVRIRVADLYLIRYEVLPFAPGGGPG